MEYSIEKNINFFKEPHSRNPKNPLTNANNILCNIIIIYIYLEKKLNYWFNFFNHSGDRGFSIFPRRRLFKLTSILRHLGPRDENYT